MPLPRGDGSVPLRRVLVSPHEQPVMLQRGSCLKVQGKLSAKQRLQAGIKWQCTRTRRKREGTRDAEPGSSWTDFCRSIQTGRTMSTIISAWQGDWKKRLLSRVREAGCKTVTEYLAMAPAQPYLRIADRLGKDIAAVQLEVMHFEEANNDNGIRNAAVDSLVREMALYLPNGWKVTTKGDFDTARVYASWIVRIEKKDEKLRAKAQATWEALEELKPPEGWLPRGPEDALICEAFLQGWPEH